MNRILFLLIMVLILSCNKEKKENYLKSKKVVERKKDTIIEKSYKEIIFSIKSNTSLDSVLSNDIDFINDSILKGKFKLDISKYELENEVKECYPIRISKKDLKEFYNEEPENLGDLNNDKIDDFGFYLHSLSYCEAGDSYYFSDNNIPRIETDSNCCHSKSLFSIGDIDEDGGNEIAQYYSSCASSFKAIIIWTLKKGKWIEVANFYHKINSEYVIFEDFHKLHKKISKGKFKFLEIYDINSKGEILKEWKTITMK